MIRTRVKICGIREGIHGLAAANGGADAIGLVFYKDSPRYITPSNAANIAELMQLYGKGAIRPVVSERYPLARAGEAIRRLASRQAMGKIVVTMG